MKYVHELKKANIRLKIIYFYYTNELCIAPFKKDKIIDHSVLRY